MNKKLKFSLLSGFPALAYFVYKNFSKLNILTGFAAKTACSCAFGAARDLASIQAGENGFLPVKYAQNEINFKEKSVTSSILGLKKRKAVYKEGLGCILLPENKSEVYLPQPVRNFSSSGKAFPLGDTEPKAAYFPEINKEQLTSAVQNAFDAKGKTIKQSRAVLVLHKNKLVAEKYDSGFSPETKFLGWSMTKSITNAVLGILEKQGRISLAQDHLFEAWENDERSKITLNNLLQMNSGLAWEEDYTTVSDVTKMLFLERNMPMVQLHKKLKKKPGKFWNYASGTTNLLSKFIRNQFNTHREYLNFWYFELIDKIGMHSMVLETDFYGNYVSSSYSLATARDWAKFGLLYLNKGNWNGKQILNERWVDYSTAPANGSNGEYGAHFWLNDGGKYPNVPRDMFACCGFQGQYVFIIPSKELVIVRFGLKEHPDFDIDVFLKEITASFRA